MCVCVFIQATSSTYKATDMCDSPAKDYGWIDPGMIHRVTLDKSVNEYLYTKITLPDALCTKTADWQLHLSSI